MYYALLLLVLIIILIAMLAYLIVNIINTNNSKKESTISVPNYYVNDCHMQRLLMIETLRPVDTDVQKQRLSTILPLLSNNGLSSELITAEHIKKEIITFNKALSNYFTNDTLQSLATLLHKRQMIFHEYYRGLQSMICDKARCVLPGINNQPIRPVFPDPLSGDSSDLTTVVERQLTEVSQEITDAIAATFNIHHKPVDNQNQSKPQFQYQRLYNLLIIYDKALINQAKSYASYDYDISMNAGNSALGIAHHINTEMLTITRLLQ